MLAYKFRLYPNKSVEEKLSSSKDLCRRTYNRLLEEYYTGITNKNELSKLLTKLKKEWPELNDVYSKCLQPEVDRLFHNLKSLRGLEKTGRKIGKLRFKGESWFKTITYNQSGFKLLPGSNKFGSLQLSKIGKIPIRLHREVKGDIKQVTIKHMSSGEWYAFLVVDDGVGKEKTTFIDKMVGIDVGLVRYVVDSDCLEIENPHHLKQQLKRLRKEQKKLSRKKRGSSNYQKQRTIVASTHEIVQNQRNDFQHKLSRYYVDNYDIIVSEKLSTDNLMEKRHLARNIADASWSSFNQKLAYKAERAGKLFVQVDPRGTSQICSSCGKLVPKSLSDRWHDCPYCGLHLSRDHNASINILNRGVEKVRSERPELTLVDTGPLQLPASSLQADWMKQEALPDKVKQFT